MVRNADNDIRSAPVLMEQQIIQRTLPTLERRVDEVIAAKPAVVDFILSNVQIVDSAGLNWFLAIQGRLDTLGMRMRLVNPSPIMSDILLATRLDSRFTVEVTDDNLMSGNGENGAPVARGGGGHHGG